MWFFQQPDTGVSFKYLHSAPINVRFTEIRHSQMTSLSILNCDITVGKVNGSAIYIFFGAISSVFNMVVVSDEFMHTKYSEFCRIGNSCTYMCSSLCCSNFN